MTHRHWIALLIGLTVHATTILLQPVAATLSDDDLVITGYGDGASYPDPCGGINGFDLGRLPANPNLFRWPGGEPQGMGGASRTTVNAAKTIAIGVGSLFYQLLESNDTTPWTQLRAVELDPETQLPRRFMNILGPRFALNGAIAFLPDGNQFLVSTMGPEAMPTDRYPGPPYRLIRLRYSDLILDSASSNDRYLAQSIEASRELDGVAAGIIPTSDGKAIHVLTDIGTLYTIASASLTDLAPPISIASPTPPDVKRAGRIANTSLAISPDGRYLVTNRAHANELNVIDVVTRGTWTLPFGNRIGLHPFAHGGGVAFNHNSSTNPGILAMHLGDQVVTFAFSDTSLDFLVLQLLSDIMTARYSQRRGGHGRDQGVGSWSDSVVRANEGMFQGALELGADGTVRARALEQRGAEEWLATGGRGW